MQDDLKAGPVYLAEEIDALARVIADERAAREAKRAAREAVV